jgi:hypothetical protein
METATYLLFILGCLGALDIALFHSIAHGIRSHADSQMELIVHSLRGPTYCLLFLVVPNFALHGFYFWCLIALFVVDVVISIWDFALERRSRQLLGGLPSGEYVLHILIAMIFGGLVTAYCFGGYVWPKLPTQIRYEPADVPSLLRMILMVMAVLVLLSGMQDAMAAWQLRRRRQRNPDVGRIA